MGTASRGTVAAFFSYGEKDYYLGGAPLWELCRVGYRSLKKPYVVGGAALALGYCYAAARRRARCVSPELMAFHRAEQHMKLKAIFGAASRLRAVRPTYSNAGGTTLVALAIQCASELAGLPVTSDLLAWAGLA